MGRIVSTAGKICNSLGVVVLIALMLLITADVTGRGLFNHPFVGTLEMSQYLMVGIIFLSLARTEEIGGQITVDLLTEHLHGRTKLILTIFVSVLGLILFSLLVWYGTFKAIDAFRIHERPMGANLIMWPARALVPFGSLLLCLRYIIDIVRNAGKLARGQET